MSSVFEGLIRWFNKKKNEDNCQPLTGASDLLRNGTGHGKPVPTRS